MVARLFFVLWRTAKKCTVKVCKLNRGGVSCWEGDEVNMWNFVNLVVDFR